jgi:hypothetical protein
VYKYHNVRAKQARAREQRVFFFLACDLTSFFLAFQVHARDRSEEYFIFIFSIVHKKKSSPNNKGLSVFLEDFDFVFSLSLLSVVCLSSLTRARHTARFVFFYFFARARFFSREDDLTHLMT